MESIKEYRKSLPVFQHKREILDQVNKFPTSIFVGETGSGKSTQIPQYLLEAGFTSQKCIAVTQPRRVGAVSLAGRVATELNSELGGKVGYSVRFDVCTSAATKIKYMTDGMLLRESIRDSLLLDYTVIVLDEAHERTVNNDILLGIVKMAQHRRNERELSPLKIVVMSATLDHEHFSKYFDDCPVYHIPGRCYGVDIKVPCKTRPTLNQTILATVFKIHQFHPEGDILVFCVGQEQIDYLVSETIECAKLLPAGNKAIFPLPLYAALPFQQQSEVFKPVASGGRKVIYATNIAETSITIPGIMYVVDPGWVKVKTYDAASGFGVLKNQRISKAQAIQRCGRAGRERPGMCFRVYSDEKYRELADQTVPEILRCNLSSVILQMIGMGIKNIAEFDFIDKPAPENIAAAVNMLKLLDAVVEKDGTLELTECGQKMIVFPLDPRFSKVIIESKKYGCTDEIVSIVAMLSVESLFYNKVDDREKFRQVREKFENLDGDPSMLLEIYKHCNRLKKMRKKDKSNKMDKPEWCKENFINIQKMNQVFAIRKQISALCRENDIPPICSNDNQQIRKCLATGFFMNAAVKRELNKYKTIGTNQEVKIHPSSCLYGKANIPCVMYVELLQTSELYMRNVIYMREETLLSVKPDYFKGKLSLTTALKPHNGKPISPWSRK